MSPSAIVRSQARETLKGNYVAAVSAFVILLLPVFINIGLNYVIDAFLEQGISDKTLLGVLEIVILTPSTIIVGVLLSPLFNGYVRMFYEGAFTKRLRITEMFCYFESGRYQKTLLLNLSFLVRMMLPAILCFLPVFLYYFFSISFLDGFVGSVLFRDFAFILNIMSSVLLILYSVKYFLVFTLYSANDQTDGRELFQISKNIMHEQRQSAIQLIFSFTPWMLLCMLVLPALYVVPYMTQSLCIGAKWMTMKGK